MSALPIFKPQIGAQPPAALDEHRLAAICHDMRQPLQALSLFVEQLQECAVGTEQQRLAVQIGSATATLDNMFGQMIAMAQLKRADYGPDLQIFSLSLLMGRLEDCYRPLAQQKQLVFRLIYDDASVYSDPVLLQRLLGNLVSNAIRFTQRGFVAVCCTRRGNRQLVEVLDSGCGIDAAQFPYIFDAYFQADRSDPASQAGLGLGLSNVRQISNQLGIEVSVRSRKGEGSVFSFEL